MVLVSANPSREFHPARLGLGFLLALGAYLLAGLLPFPEGTDPYRGQMAAAITAFVATAWLTSSMPLGPASLLPLPLFSLLGVLPLSAGGDDNYGAATAYAHPILWLFFGGFALALGIERWGLHRRIALGIITRFGTEPSRLVLGFMVAAAFLSMWLMNTSTTLMLLPIAMALVDSMARSGALAEQGQKDFAFALLVGIAYACSIGGLGTPIGTAPNAIFLSVYAPFEEAGAPKMTFLLWMVTMLPLVLVMLPLVWLLLTKVLGHPGSADPKARDVLMAEAKALPPMSSAERRMLYLFMLAAALWITRRDLQLGELVTIPGWWHLMPVPNGKWVEDGAVAVAVCLLGFVIPSGRAKGEALLNWDTVKKLPWDILYLLGGGIVIAEAFRQTGLAAAMGHAMQPALMHLPPLLAVIVVCAVMTFLTEVTSNTAMTALMLPILLAAGVASGIDPRLLMLPATLSASCAFMLPVATPPNAIVFSTGWLPMARMAKVGFYINLLGIGLITMLTWWVARPVLGISTETPAWLNALQP